jgi:hypothetical protein
VRWTVGGATDPIVGAVGLLSPRAISGDGNVVVGIMPIMSQNTRAFRWEAATGASLYSAFTRDATCVDRTGVNVGIKTTGGAAARFTGATNQVQLSALQGDVDSYVLDISEDGRVLAGYSRSSSFLDRAVIWIDGVPAIICPQPAYAPCDPTPLTLGTVRIGGGQGCTFRLEQAPGGSAGVFFYGLGTSTSTVSPSGMICAPGACRRRVPNTQRLGGTCGAVFVFELNALARGGSEPALLVGTQLVGQFWYRDAAAPGGAAMSEAERCFLAP